MNILTIDTGTTNTRVTVWRDDVALCQAARQVGVRDTAITGNRTTLQRGVQDTIDAALQKAGFGMGQVDLVLASGMITSNVGLHEVPHLIAPAGLRDLAAGMVQASIPEVCPQPIWFVPGVRNPVDNLGLHNIESMDMMRKLSLAAMAVAFERGSVAQLSVTLFISMGFVCTHMHQPACSQHTYVSCTQHSEPPPPVRARRWHLPRMPPCLPVQASSPQPC